jgi:L,D-peptidoglycan transpeptidase YkuD (ErfK/YbiS/YcfS/YnhG family)
MIGLALSHIWRGYGSAIFLEFGDLRERLKRDGSKANPAGQMSLMIEWSWRIEDHATIRCGSWSEEEFWPDAFAAILGNQVLGRVDGLG